MEIKKISSFLSESPLIVDRAGICISEILTALRNVVDSPIRSTDSVRMGFQVSLSSSRDIDVFRLSTNIRHI